MADTNIPVMYLTLVVSLPFKFLYICKHIVIDYTVVHSESDSNYY